MDEKELEKILDMKNDLYKEKILIDSIVEETVNYSHKYESENGTFSHYFGFGIIMTITGIIGGVDWIRNIGIVCFIIGILGIPLVLKKEKELETKKKILKDYIFALKKKDKEEIKND